MKQLEVRLFIEINEKQTSTEDVIFHLETAIDETINGVVKRVDLIDEIQTKEIEQ